MITYATETFGQALAGVQDILREQWAHTGDAEIECRPNWELYYRLDQAGALLVMVVREDDRLMGYLVAIVHPHVNSVHTRQATIATYYVEPREQRAVILRRLIDTALRHLEQRGIHYVSIKTEYRHSCGRLLEAMGFTPHEIGYKMLFRKPEERRCA